MGVSRGAAHFRMAEDNVRGASPYHGAGGPMPVADTTDPHAGHLAFLEAARELGFAADPRWDFNAPSRRTARGSIRRTCAMAGATRRRPHLHVPFSAGRISLCDRTRRSGGCCSPATALPA